MRGDVAQPFLVFGVYCLMLSSILGAAVEIEASRTSFEDEPTAHAIYDRMLETVRNAKTLYYESEYRWEHRGFKTSPCTYKFWAKKPNFACLEVRMPSQTLCANMSETITS